MLFSLDNNVSALPLACVGGDEIPGDLPLSAGLESLALFSNIALKLLTWLMVNVVAWRTG